MTELTCLMAVYNAEEFLAQSIESVLSQCYSDFHFLIFDDGSTDQSLAILQKYAQEDSRIQLFSEKNPFGLPYALNQLMKKVKTPYFILQGASDLSHPKRFKTLLTQIKKSSLVALGSSVIWDEEPLGKTKEIKTVSEYAKKILEGSFNHPKTPSFYYLSGIYSKKICKKKIEFDETIPAYYDILFMGWIQNHFPLRMSNTREVLYTYRIFPGSMLDLVQQKKIRVDFEQIENFFLDKLANPYLNYVVESQVYRAIIPF